MDYSGPIEVLLVEDNPGDVRLVKEALRDFHLPLHLTVARDGEEALQLLFGFLLNRKLQNQLEVGGMGDMKRGMF